MTTPTAIPKSQSSVEHREDGWDISPIPSPPLGSESAYPDIGHQILKSSAAFPTGSSLAPPTAVGGLNDFFKTQDQKTQPSSFTQQPSSFASQPSSFNAQSNQQPSSFMVPVSAPAPKKTFVTPLPFDPQPSSFIVSPSSASDLPDVSAYRPTTGKVTSQPSVKSSSMNEFTANSMDFFNSFGMGPASGIKPQPQMTNAPLMTPTSKTSMMPPASKGSMMMPLSKNSMMPMGSQSNFGTQKLGNSLADFSFDEDPVPAKKTQTQNFGFPAKSTAPMGNTMGSMGTQSNDLFDFSPVVSNQPIPTPSPLFNSTKAPLGNVGNMGSMGNMGSVGTPSTYKPPQVDNSLSGLAAALGQPQPNFPSMNPAGFSTSTSTSTPDFLGGSAALPAANPMQPKIMVVVAEPQRKSSALSSWWTFQLGTKVAYPGTNLKEQSFVVERRDSDFDWLYQHFTADFPELCIPPLPEKIKYDMANIKRLQRDLARFYDALMRHPELSKTQVLKIFTEYPEDKFRPWIKNAKIENRLVAGSWFKSESTDPRVIKTKQFLTDLTNSLTSIITNIERIHKQQIETFPLWTSFGESMDAYARDNKGKLEDNFSIAVHHASKDLTDQAATEMAAFTEPIRFWLRYCKEGQDLVARHEIAEKNFQGLQQAYEKRKVQYEALTDIAKQDSLRPSVDEAYNKAKVAENMQQKIMNSMMNEMAKFQRDKSSSMSRILMNFATSQRVFHTKLANTWNAVLKP
eukprot:TRINITY_DN9827_c0_g1_i4.p1 TRINITY_DN9827_c0_g1~~TRINITY_DN9827_c0_g1_i4.p1  ORF type:complete len:848 (-),score=234.45 TRINITY_DN9827_c0_g1_i4:306-2522(-)